MRSLVLILCAAEILSADSKREQTLEHDNIILTATIQRQSAQLLVLQSKLDAFAVQLSRSTSSQAAAERGSQAVAAANGQQAAEIQQLRAKLDASNLQLSKTTVAGAKTSAEVLAGKAQNTAVRKENMALAKDKRDLQAATALQTRQHIVDVAAAQRGIDATVEASAQAKVLVEVLTQQFTRWQRNLVIILLSCIMAQMLLTLTGFLITVRAGRR